MPKYTFSCEECGKQAQYFSSIDSKQKTCECGGIMQRKLPTLLGAKTTETVDKYTNQKHIDDHKSVLKERKLDYYWKHEVPKMVNSGTYSIETMLEQGWIQLNEKGEMIINTKPPQKR